MEDGDIGENETTCKNLAETMKSTNCYRSDTDNWKEIFFFHQSSWLSTMMERDVHKKCYHI